MGVHRPSKQRPGPRGREQCSRHGEPRSWGLGEPQCGDVMLPRKFQGQVGAQRKLCGYRVTLPSFPGDLGRGYTSRVGCHRVCGPQAPRLPRLGLSTFLLNVTKKVRRQSEPVKLSEQRCDSFGALSGSLSEWETEWTRGRGVRRLLRRSRGEVRGHGGGRA